jgi:hypothetical protein
MRRPPKLGTSEAKRRSGIYKWTYFDKPVAQRPYRVCLEMEKRRELSLLRMGSLKIILEGASLPKKKSEEFWP